MTDAEIKNLRDLMRAATPGPLTVMARNAGEQCVAVVNQLELVPPNGVELAHEKADADFLAAAVNALPGLLDEIERLRRDGFDSRHPAAQNLLGRNARLSIALDIVRDILADDCEPTPITAEHWAPIHDQVQSVIRKRNELREEVERLRDELETERMRVVACGVIALSNTRESAERQRKMHQKYRCASVIDVERAVDREMDLYEEVERLRAALEVMPAPVTLEAAELAIDVFKAEEEQMLADAARYRWLRDVGDYMMPPTPGVIRLDINDHIEHLSGDALDAAIDAAIGEEKRE